MFSKRRIEALSDGVFAIAMTLLILDLKVPLDTPPGQLGAALLHDVASWVSFMVTFGSQLRPGACNTGYLIGWRR